MRKAFYRLMCLATATAMSLIGCERATPLPEYGAPFIPDDDDNQERTAPATPQGTGTNSSTVGGTSLTNIVDPDGLPDTVIPLYGVEMPMYGIEPVLIDPPPDK